MKTLEIGNKVIVPGTINGWGEDLVAIIIEIQIEGKVIAKYLEPTVNSGYSICCDLSLLIIL